MTINPYILLGIGSTFAVLYALVIIFGWARTRRNRRKVHNAIGTTVLPIYNLDGSLATGETVATVSLRANTFTDKDGTRIEPSDYDAYIARGTSAYFPNVNDGDLLLFDRTTRQLAYAFSVPNLKNYR